MRHYYRSKRIYNKYWYFHKVKKRKTLGIPLSPFFRKYMRYTHLNALVNNSRNCIEEVFGTRSILFQNRNRKRDFKKHGLLATVNQPNKSIEKQKDLTKDIGGDIFKPTLYEMERLYINKSSGLLQVIIKLITQKLNVLRTNNPNGYTGKY